MTCNFRVGQKVVCINDEPGFNGPIAPIRKSGVYTITAITEGTSHLGPDFGLVLAEAPRMPEGYIGYSAGRFRPLAEPKTDISIFKAMLAPSKVREAA